MNLNLLPDKYVKNRAPMLLLTGYVIFVGVTFVLIMLFFGLLTVSVNKQRNLVSMRKVEQVSLTKNIKGLKNANSVEVQEAIRVLREKQILTNQVVKTFDETFKKSESVLWNFELNLAASEEKSFDNQELISVDLSGAASYYGQNGVKKVIADLEEIPWVYSAILVTSSLHEGSEDMADVWANQANVHDMTIQVKLVKDALPNIGRNTK